MGKSKSASCLRPEDAKKWPIFDLDSSDYWPGSSSLVGLPWYLCKIIDTAAVPGAIVLVSAHKPVRQALRLLGVTYVSVRPPGDPNGDKKAKQIYEKTKQIYLKREVSPPPIRRDLFAVQTVLRALRVC